MLPLPGWRYAGTFAAFAEAKRVYLERLKGVSGESAIGFAADRVPASLRNPTSLRSAPGRATVHSRCG